MSAAADARLANLVGALALALSDRMRDVTEVATGHHATAPAALVALHEFLDRGTMDQLRRVVGLTPSGAVRLVDRLVDAGLVDRRGGSDGRSVALVLTPKGTAAAQRVLAARASALDGLLGELSDGERAALTDLSEKLLASITTQRLAARDVGETPAGGWLCRLCDFDACGRPDGVCPTANAAAAYTSYDSSGT